MTDIDWHRLAKRINPKPDGQDVLRLRVGVVDALNTDGTIDVLLDEVLLDKPVPVLAGALVEVGLPVQLLSYRGSLLAIGTSLSAPGPVINKPLVRLVANATQTLASGSNVMIQYGTGSTSIDTDNFHNEALLNTRITPTVPGYYEARVTLAVAARSDYNFIETGVMRNGSAVAPHNRVGPNTNSSFRSVTASALVSMNGTTDYVEQRGSQANTAAVSVSTNQSSQYSSVFELEYKRPL